MSKWLVVSNCQTFGLANSLQSLNPGLDVEVLSIWEFQRDLADVLPRLSAYDTVVASREVAGLEGADLEAARNLIVVPQLTFGGYHPDVTAAFDEDGNQLKGPLSDYHSLLAVAAFNKGLSVKDTASLFTARTYEAAGYFDAWDHEKQVCIENMALAGLDIRQEFPRWGRGTPFMYSPNHPRIGCMFSIAKLVLKGRGLSASAPEFLPEDNLISGPIYPVFPEIAEARGALGSMRFKPAGSYKTLDLKSFLEASFETYRAMAESGKAVVAKPEHRYAKLLNII